MCGGRAAGAAGTACCVGGAGRRLPGVRQWYCGPGVARAVAAAASQYRGGGPTAGAAPAAAPRRVEGEKLSRKNGELEAAARRVRAQLRDAEADR